MEARRWTIKRSTTCSRPTGEVKWHPLTRAKMVHGINAAAKHWRMSVEAFVEDADADMADTAVQFALFGEIVYG
jgi:hypothetical protein